MQKSVKKRIMNFLAILVIAYILILAVLLASVNYLIFPKFRAAHMTCTPGEYHLKYEDVSIDVTGGVKLCAWYIPCASTSELCIIYNHGNAENISTALSHAVDLAGSLKANLFIYDYRGYARSGGSPSYKTFYDDADAVLNYITSRPDQKGNKFIIYGRSLGGAAAIHMASKYNCHRLITESTFASVPLHVWFQPILFIFSPFVPDYLPSLSKASSIKAPWLIIHGGQDGVINVKNSDVLYRSECEAKKSIFIVEKARHNDVMRLNKAEYLRVVSRFAAGE